MKYSALLRPASSPLSIDMRMTTRVANAVRTLKKTAKASYTAIPSKIAFPLPGAETPARRIAAPTPTRARIAGAADVFRLNATCRTTSRRIVAVTASSGRKYGRLPRLPRNILVAPFINAASHRERRCAAPARRATEAYCEVRRKERNAAGADAAALECSRIYESGHLDYRLHEVDQAHRGGVQQVQDR